MKKHAFGATSCARMDILGPSITLPPPPIRDGRKTVADALFRDVLESLGSFDKGVKMEKYRIRQNSEKDADGHWLTSKEEITHGE